MLRKFLHWAGVDDGTIFSLLNRVVTLSFGLVTLSLIVVFLPAVQQGYYFTFSSLLVLQTFLELGMATVLIQFVAHEWSHVETTSNGQLSGDGVALDRICGIVRVGLRWYAAVSLGFFTIVGTLGMIFLTWRGSAPGILGPWWSLCGAVSLSILQLPLRAFLEGSNQVSRVQRIATLIYSCASISGWLALIAGLQLYALPITAGTTALLGLALYGRASLPFVRLARQKSYRSSFSWREEFWPQQWRIAVSYMSGFCMFQSFVPAVFLMRGPVLAGQMGASIQLFNAVHSVGQAWINAKGPQMGILGARGQWEDLANLIHRTWIRATVAVALCTLVALCGILILKVTHYKADRFVGLVPMAALLLTSTLLQRTAIETLAIRFQKIEPFVLNSMTSAALVLASNLLASKYLGLFGVCFGFAAIMLGVVAPWTHRTYRVRMANLWQTWLLKDGRPRLNL